ncbi:hypothetical protein J5N97_027213 [Dioscorea zingiberensis]|uniref:Uncharacterized protein n=1 Tax=Dioscorea zingiberensis TaxID=325984 RepID=A0A9D5H7H5_9LILI|nr:hypothetical protein J5N97_027213 [Dioscorea zingiberensis]
MAGLKSLLVCLSIVIVDLVAGILAIAAQAAQDKDKNHCNPTAPTLAYKLSISGQVLMAVALLIAEEFTTQPRLHPNSDSARTPTHIKVASITRYLAWGLFIFGAVMICSATWTSYSKYKLPCSFSEHHLLIVGGVVCFIHAVEVNPCNPQSNTLAYKFGFGAAVLMLVAFIITYIFTDRPRFRSSIGPARKPTSMKVA